MGQWLGAVYETRSLGTALYRPASLPSRGRRATPETLPGPFVPESSGPEPVKERSVMRLAYLHSGSIPSVYANGVHVMRMCDAFTRRAMRSPSTPCPDRSMPRRLRLLRRTPPLPHPHDRSPTRIALSAWGSGRRGSVPTSAAEAGPTSPTGETCQPGCGPDLGPLVDELTCSGTTGSGGGWSAGCSGLAPSSRS